METLIYAAIVFAISCVGIFIALKMCNDPPPGGFGSWVFVLLILGTLATGIMYAATHYASALQEQWFGPVNLEEGRRAIEFLIYTGLVFAEFFALCSIGIIIDGKIDWGEFGRIVLACIIFTVVSIGITFTAHAIQDSFKAQPEPPAIERINFDEGAEL